MSNTPISKAENSFESVFNHVTEGILIANSKGEIILSNPKCVQLFGYDTDELKGLKVEVLVPNDIKEKHTEYRNAYMRSPMKRPMGKTMILRGKRKDGSLFPVEISLSYYETEEGLYVIAFIIDITDRHEQQEKISKINNELRLLNETLEKKVTERTLVLKEALTELEKSRDELTNALEKRVRSNSLHLIQNVSYFLSERIRNYSSVPCQNMFAYFLITLQCLKKGKLEKAVFVGIDAQGFEF
jgi:PAS domain S-box-containing protein